MVKKIEGALREYLDEVGELPPNVVMGHIVMFTIVDTPVDRSDLEKNFVDLGLDVGLLPPEIQPLDAFKKATSEAKDKYIDGKGNKVSVMCREVKATPTKVERQITREVNSGNLDYSNGIRCLFLRGQPALGRTTIERGSERVKVRVNDDGLAQRDAEELHKIADAIERRYKGYYAYLDGNKIRAVVRSYLGHINAIPLRAGVYFVRSARYGDLVNLQTLVQRIGNGCSMDLFPLVDLPKEREVVIEAFQRDASGKLSDIVKEIVEVKASGKKITGAAYARLKDRYDLIMTQAQEYLETLGLSQDVTASSAELALDALTDLQVTMLKQPA